MAHILTQKIPMYGETKTLKTQRRVKEYIYFIMRVHNCSEAEAWEYLALQKSTDYARR